MKLQLGIVSLISLPFWRGVLGGQIPKINGVYGDVPSAVLFAADSVIAQKKVLVESTIKTTQGKLQVVENSGICETTPGVYQASGYGDLTKTESLWFWFFAARKNPESAPLVLWFNGGPGSSSMIGLLQEHGPCRITNDTFSVTLNPYSWNNEANILYIDQPVGVGFSHGDLKVGTSQKAAADIWTFMQIFLSDDKFAKYSQRKLAIWTESYGGHYAPAFATHFLAQNAAIAAGEILGIHLNLQVLGIGNGLTDPLVQYPGYLSYAATNPYHRLVSQSDIDQAKKDWSTPVTGCKDQITACNNAGSNSVCSAAQSYCNNKILGSLSGDYDVYFVLAEDPDFYPPALDSYLNNVAPKIGAEVRWSIANLDVYANFAKTGDWMRNSRPDLEALINAGIRTVIYDGDADYILNYQGVEAMVDALDTKFTKTYKGQIFQPYNVTGHLTGQFKNAGTFSYVRVYGAGHEVPAYKHGKLAYGQAAAQIFTQIMGDESLYST
ncbi:serine carboxypeptidase [Phlegmacium glaucopus]|nr:serine carboxypeptidase [Phlegmacium glaucopus]